MSAITLPTITSDHLAALDDDGATVELGDGWSLRLVIEPDCDKSVMDDHDWYGALEWAGPRNVYGWRTRPKGFDGRARILIRDKWEDLWWQPPKDVPDEDLPCIESRLRDLLHYGYSAATVELRQTLVDAIGGEHVVVVDAASVGGIEPFDIDDEGFRCDLLADLVAELT